MFRFLSAIVLCFFLIGLSIDTAYADDGIDDPNFDYLAPEKEGITSSLTSFLSSRFRKPKHAANYIAAKRKLYKIVKDPETLYCGCKTNLSERTFNSSICGYVPKQDNIRARRLEAEHVLPASLIAKFSSNQCWKKQPGCGSARECCLSNDSEFKKAHNDLVNLMPTIGELNADRSNLLYRLIDGESRAYGRCDFEVDTSSKSTEPKNEIRGDISRIYFYMRDTYGLTYPSQLEERLEEWANDDPISSLEIDRNKKVKRAQGSSNPLF